MKPSKHTTFDAWIAKEYTTPDEKQRLAAAVTEAKVALRIAELRHKQGISQQDLAHKLHTKQQYVSRIEQPNNTSISVRTLAKLADIFHKKLVIDFV